MFERILLAAGGQEASEPARVAAGLCRALGSRLTIVSVYPRTANVLGEPTYSQSVNARAEQADVALTEAAQVAAAEGVASAELESLDGDPADRIVSLARDGGFDLVVMGTRQRGRFGAALLGSVSAAVAAHAGVPVPIVPERAARPPAGK